jgi:hypothetical protein
VRELGFRTSTITVSDGHRSHNMLSMSSAGDLANRIWIVARRRLPSVCRAP